MRRAHGNGRGGALRQGCRNGAVRSGGKFEAGWRRSGAAPGSPASRRAAGGGEGGALRGGSGPGGARGGRGRARLDGGCLSPQPPGRRPGLGAADAGRQPPPHRQDRGARPPAGPAAPGPVREPHPPHRGAERPGEPAHPESVRQPDNESGGSAVFVSVRLAA